MADESVGAIHEASHALAMCRSGAGFDYVELFDEAELCADGSWAGGRSVGLNKRFTSPDVQLKVSVVGLAAELLLASGNVSPAAAAAHASSDMKMAAALASSHEGGRPGVEAAMRWAATFVRENEAKIRAIARALDKHRRLTAGEVRAAAGEPMPAAARPKALVRKAAPAPKATPVKVPVKVLRVRRPAPLTGRELKKRLKAAGLVPPVWWGPV